MANIFKEKMAEVGVMRQEANSRGSLLIAVLDYLKVKKALSLNPWSGL
jgi:hypothetical protein